MGGGGGCCEEDERVWVRGLVGRTLVKRYGRRVSNVQQAELCLTLSFFPPPHSSVLCALLPPRLRGQAVGPREVWKFEMFALV